MGVRSGGAADRRPSILRSEILHESLDVVEFELRAEAFAKASSQLLQDASHPLCVDLARHLHSEVIAVVAAAHWPAEWIRVLLSASVPTARPAIGAWAYALLLHRLRQSLCTFAHGVQRAPLAVDCAIGISLSELAFRLAHGLPGVAELAQLVCRPLLEKKKKIHTKTH